VIRDDWQPLRTIGTYTRRSPTAVLIETYHDGYEVNETGAFIWSMVGSRRTAREIAGEFAERYRLTPEHARNVVDDFLMELLARGFVVPED
jgi:hypothetical protein